MARPYGAQMSAKLCDDALALIRQRVADRGYPPSNEEIQDHLGLGSRAAAMRILDRLQREGRIERVKGQARAIRIVDMKARTEPM